MNKEKKALGAVGGQALSTQNPQTNMQVAPVYPIQQQSAVPFRSRKVEYYVQQVRLLGGLQLNIGVNAIIFQTYLIGLDLPIVGTSIWCGMFFILTGLIGARYRKTKTCLIVTFIVLNIIAASIFGWCWVSLLDTGISKNSNWFGSDPSAPLTFNAVMLIFLLEFTITIWSAFLWWVVCHKGHSHSGDDDKPNQRRKSPLQDASRTTNHDDWGAGAVLHHYTPALPGAAMPTQTQTQQYSSHYDFYVVAVRLLGTLLLTIGVKAIILQITLMCLDLPFVGTSIWCGMFFILTGLIGICYSKTKTCLIVTFIVLNIIAASIFGWCWVSLLDTGISKNANWMVISPTRGGKVLYTMPQGPQIMMTGGQVQYYTTTHQLCQEQPCRLKRRLSSTPRTMIQSKTLCIMNHIGWSTLHPMWPHLHRHHHQATSLTTSSPPTSKWTRTVNTLIQFPILQALTPV